MEIEELAGLDLGLRKKIVEELPFETVYIAIHQMSREFISSFIEGLPQTVRERFEFEAFGLCRGLFTTKEFEISQKQVLETACKLAQKEQGEE